MAVWTIRSKRKFQLPTIHFQRLASFLKSKSLVVLSKKCILAPLNMFPSQKTKHLPPEKKGHSKTKKKHLPAGNSAFVPFLGFIKWTPLNGDAWPSTIRNQNLVYNLYHRKQASFLEKTLIVFWVPQSKKDKQSHPFSKHHVFTNGVRGGCFFPLSLFLFGSLRYQTKHPPKL